MRKIRDVLRLSAAACPSVRLVPAKAGTAASLGPCPAAAGDCIRRARQAGLIWPLLALAWDQHHQSLSERFADAPPAPENPTPVEAMAHRPRTPEGKKLYALRKHTPEPVFGIIKLVPAQPAPAQVLCSVRLARASSGAT